MTGLASPFGFFLPLAYKASYSWSSPIKGEITSVASSPSLPNFIGFFINILSPDISFAICQVPSVSSSASTTTLTSSVIPIDFLTFSISFLYSFCFLELGFSDIALLYKRNKSNITGLFRFTVPAASCAFCCCC